MPERPDCSPMRLTEGATFLGRHADLTSRATASPPVTDDLGGRRPSTPRRGSLPNGSDTNVGSIKIASPALAPSLSARHGRVSTRHVVTLQGGVPHLAPGCAGNPTHYRHFVDDSTSIDGRRRSNGVMAYQRIRVGFSDREVYEFVERQAARAGCSASEYARNAVVMRAAFDYARGTPTDPNEIVEVQHALECFLERLVPSRRGLGDSGGGSS